MTLVERAVTCTDGTRFGLFINCVIIKLTISLVTTSDPFLASEPVTERARERERERLYNLMRSLSERIRALSSVRFPARAGSHHCHSETVPARRRSSLSPPLLILRFPGSGPCGVINFRLFVMSGALRGTPKFASARSGAGSAEKGPRDLANKTPAIARVYSSLPVPLRSRPADRRIHPPNAREGFHLREPKSGKFLQESLSVNEYSVVRLSGSSRGSKRGHGARIAA